MFIYTSKYAPACLAVGERNKIIGTDTFRRTFEIAALGFTFAEQVGGVG